MQVWLLSPTLVHSVFFSKYSDMNDAKALLESIARNYGSRLAKRGIRVNTVSQAPTKTSAGTGIKGFDGMYTFAEKLAPLGNPSADECADYCITLFSDLTPQSDHAELVS